MPACSSLVALGHCGSYGASAAFRGLVSKVSYGQITLLVRLLALLSIPNAEGATKAPSGAQRLLTDVRRRLNTPMVRLMIIYPPQDVRSTLKAPNIVWRRLADARAGFALSWSSELSPAASQPLGILVCERRHQENDCRSDS